MVSRSSVMPRMRSSLAIASSKRLRACMTFWLFSGWFQKSGEEICSSVSASFFLCAGASKIPPHGQGLVAQRLVLTFEFFEGHGSQLQFSIESLVISSQSTVLSLRHQRLFSFAAFVECEAVGPTPLRSRLP